MALSRYLVFIYFLIFYSCSVDPYLFENFNTVDGDFLTAKFRAFKFPESTYVQFKGTVNVCLDKCRGVSKIIINTSNVTLDTYLRFSKNYRGDW